MRCVITVTYDFCFNGMTVGPISPRRGLRQGDPLSPYLLLFYVEGLSNILDKSATYRNIHGCCISTTLRKSRIFNLLMTASSF